MKKRIPFDLEKAKQGAKIVNVFGTEHEFIAHIPNAKFGNRLVIMNKESKTVFALEACMAGLSIEVEEKVIWVNVFRDDCGMIFTRAYTIEEDALFYKSQPKATYVGTYPITL